MFELIATSKALTAGVVEEIVKTGGPFANMGTGGINMLTDNVINEKGSRTPIVLSNNIPMPACLVTIGHNPTND